MKSNRIVYLRYNLNFCYRYALIIDIKYVEIVRRGCHHISHISCVVRKSSQKLFSFFKHEKFV